MPQRHVPPPLLPADARKLLDRLLGVPDSLVLTHHFRHRQRQRNFDDYDVQRVLDKGMICADEWSDNYGEWKYRIRGLDIDGVELTLIAVLSEMTEKIYLITGL
jgi:hypothetical protein